VATPFLPVYDVRHRDIFMTRLAAAVGHLMRAAESNGLFLVGAGVNPYSASSGSEIRTLCADYHQIEVLDDDEVERIYNLFRQFLPELLALSSNSGIYAGEIQRDFSLRMRLNPASYLPRYISQFSKSHLDHLKALIRKEHAIADLSQMDVNPLAEGAIELRFVDAQCSYPFIRAQIVLFQAIAMYGRSLARRGRRLPFMRNEVISENKVLAIQGGATAILKPDSDWKAQDGKGFWFHHYGTPERVSTSLLMILNGLLLPHLRDLRTEWWELAPLLLGAELRRRGKRCLVNYAEYQKYLFYSVKQHFSKTLQQQMQQLLIRPDLDFVSDYNRSAFGDLAIQIEQEWSTELKLPERKSGVVQWFDPEKQYGFIAQDDGGEDIFVHRADLEGLSSLQAGQAITYVVKDTREGPRAVKVRLRPQVRKTGWVKWFDNQKHYGFIAGDDGTDVFVHQAELEEVSTLVQGQLVTYEVAVDPRGQKAVRVQAKGGTGQVKWFDGKKRYGFISQDNGTDVFVHQEDVKGRKPLRPGQRVSYMLGMSDKGPKAILVRPE